jgi:hypothetical protein
MPCEECRDLQSHEFRSPTDLVHAFQVAAAEMERGVLRRVNREERSVHEEAAVYSALRSDALPGTMRYRFECAVCGDRFELWGDSETGEGAWTREEPA